MQHRIQRFMAVLVSLAVAGVCHAELLNFTAVIDGPQAEDCAGESPGTGSGTFTLDTDTRQVDFEITFAGLIGREIESHIHGGAAACADAPFFIVLPLGSPKIGTYFVTPIQAGEMIDELHYVVIHTDVVIPGEIRGQILLAEEVPIPTVSEWGLILLTVLIASVAAIVFKRRVSPAVWGAPRWSVPASTIGEQLRYDDWQLVERADGGVGGRRS